MAKTKDQKQEEAIKRQEKYASKSTSEKLQAIKKRPGSSKKETERILKDK